MTYTDYEQTARQSAAAWLVEYSRLRNLAVAQRAFTGRPINPTDVAKLYSVLRTASMVRAYATPLPR